MMRKWGTVGKIGEDGEPFENFFGCFFENINKIIGLEWTEGLKRLWKKVFGTMKKG